MSNDEITKWMEGIRKEKETRALAYARFKGMVKGVEITTVNKNDKDMLGLIEIVFDNAKNFGDSINQIEEMMGLLLRRIEALEQVTKVLKNSMDTLDQNR